VQPAPKIASVPQARSADWVFAPLLLNAAMALVIKPLAKTARPVPKIADVPPVNLVTMASV
jgi:hypothetical protein